MADPTKYTKSYNFSGFQANNPSEPLPAQEVDSQFSDIENSIGEIVDGLKDVRRSDGALKNGIVTLDSLADDVAAQVGDGMLAAQTAAAASATAAAGSATAAAASATASAASAAALTGTSTSSVVLGTGSKSFVTQAGKQFSAGTPLTVTSDGSPTTRIMSGVVSSYVGTALTVLVDGFTGTGTYTDWTIHVSGTRGAKGDPGSAGAGTGDMLKTENLSGLANYATARGNLGLGTAAVVDLIDENSMATNSATKLPSQKSVKAYVDALGATLGTAATLASVDEDDMISNSAVKLPTQQSVKAYVDAAVATVVGARTIKTTVYDTAGSYTYTKDAHMLFAEVFVQAGGGGGGGGAGDVAGALGVGAGGGGGAFRQGLYKNSDLGATESVVVGAGGAGGLAAGATNGTGGNTSSFGALISCSGGAGGTGSGTAGGKASPCLGGAGGTGTGGDDGRVGSPGDASVYISGLLSISGRGGDSARGAGGRSVIVASTAGNNGAAYGGGGSGGMGDRTSTTNRAGGAGAGGIVIIKEYLSQ